MAQSRFPFPSYPSGWFCVALSDEISATAPTILKYFGRELVAYRGESGAAYVMDAYCAHLGAHLGHGGVVEGEALRCPFHGWRFGGDGRCTHIPYSDRVPPKARIEAFEVLEQNGAIHVFYDPRGREPWALPALEEEGWTKGRTIRWDALRTHPQEVFENTLDTAHIGPVHGGLDTRLTEPPTRDGPRMIASIEFQAPGDVVGMPGEINDVHLHVTMNGLGCTHVRTHVRNVDVHARQQIFATPIDEHTCDLRGIVQVRATDDPEFTEELERTFYEAFCTDFAKDFPIWENKAYLERPGLAKGDGPIGTYRKWCRQFYVDAPAGSDAPDVRARDLLGKLSDRWIAPARERLDEWLARRSPPAATTPSVSAPTPRVAPRPKASRPVSSVAEYFETLEARFEPSAAKGLDAVFQWELTGDGGQTFHAAVSDGSVDIRRGAHAEPSVSLVIDADDYVKVVNGDLDGAWAFTKGGGRVRGSVRAAMKMRTVFPA